MSKNGSDKSEKQRTTVKTQRIVDLLLPPIIAKIAETYGPRQADFVGDYGSFAEAREHSNGYDAAPILEKVTDAALKVKRGEAVFERDSIAFEKPAPPFPLLAALSYSCLADDGRLRVLDFGGSLGSVYFQVRRFFARIPLFRWSIVEQAHFVERGKQLFENDELRFYRSVDECCNEQKPNVVLASGSLTYVDEPYSLLEKLCYLSDCRHLILDRTAFISSFRDRIAVQRVPDSIYGGSYPARLFGSGHLLPLLREHWEIVAEWQALGGLVRSSARTIEYRGLALDRRRP